MRYPARLVVVLNNIAQKYHLRGFLLTCETGRFVLFRRHPLLCVPALCPLIQYRLREIKHRGETALIADKQRQLLRLFVEDFPDRESVVFAERLIRHFVQEIQHAFGLKEHIVNTAKPVVPVRRIVAERQGLFDIDNRVNAESGDPLVQPPVDHAIDFTADF